MSNVKTQVKEHANTFTGLAEILYHIFRIAIKFLTNSLTKPICTVLLLCQRSCTFVGLLQIETNFIDKNQVIQLQTEVPIQMREHKQKTNYSNCPFPKSLCPLMRECLFMACACICMAVARNLCAAGGGGGGGGKPEACWRRKSLGGSGGMLPQKILKLRSPEMPFPEAISSSYLIQVMVF